MNKIEIQLLVKDEVTSHLKRIKGQTSKTTKSMKADFVALAAQVYVFEKAVRMAGSALGMFIDAAAKFEQLEVRLTQMLGSVEEANRLFDDMATLAGRTKYTFDEVMMSVTNLSAVVKNGADEISQLMPIIMDISSTFGISIQDTTSQFIRMMSAGAASADMFRERGVTAALGFQAGVSYTAEETMNQVTEIWEEGTNRMVGATDNLSETWDARVGMMGDAWIKFKAIVGEEIIESEATKSILDDITDTFNNFVEQAEAFKRHGESIWNILNPIHAVLNQQRMEIEAVNDLLIEQGNVHYPKIANEAEKVVATKDQELASLKKIEAMHKKIEKAFSKSLSNMITGTKSVKESFEALGKSMIQIIVDYVAEQFIAMTVGEALAKMATASSVAQATVLAGAWEPAAVFAATATAGGAVVAGMSALGGAFATTTAIAAAKLGAAAGGVAAMADGGIVTRPTLALIGEAGPEAVVPLSGNRGMSSNTYIEINNPVVRSDEDIEELTEEISRRINFEAERI